MTEIIFFPCPCAWGSAAFWRLSMRGKGRRKPRTISFFFFFSLPKTDWVQNKHSTGPAQAWLYIRAFFLSILRTFSTSSHWSCNFQRQKFKISRKARVSEFLSEIGWRVWKRLINNNHHRCYAALTFGRRAGSQLKAYTELNESLFSSLRKAGPTVPFEFAYIKIFHWIFAYSTKKLALGIRIYIKTFYWIFAYKE